MKMIKELRHITEEYETALKARYRQDPLANLKAAIPARFFYLQGLAAFLAKLPTEYRKYGWAVRTGEAFMVNALRIAPTNSPKRSCYGQYISLSCNERGTVMSMNPRETTERICTDYQEYIASILNVKDREISDLAHNAVRKTDFVKGRILRLLCHLLRGKALKNLANEGLISKEFSSMGKNVHFEDWNLRIHQEKALRQIIEEHRNMAVSTGTGSGKTECYLYPIFNSLMREKEAGTLDAGVRALLIFPNECIG